MKAAVVFWSGTGNTEAMANAVAEGLKGAGAEVSTFGPAEFNADNDLSMGNMQYVLPERDYVSMYSDLRVWSDGEISYIGIQYELGYPNFASMYFFPGSTIESRVYDEYEETEVNGIPAAYVYNDGLATHNYYFERPEGIYFIKFQLPSPDDTMEQYMNDLMASISFAD